MSDETRNTNDKAKGFRKYGAPVPARHGAPIPSDEETEEIDASKTRDGSASRVPTGD